MIKSEQINDLAAALSKAQAMIKGAVKDAKNPFFKSQYADLTSVWEACRDALTKNGLSVVQCPEQSDGGGIAVETTLMHSSGQYITSRYAMPVKNIDAQSIGSAITYARRYALSAMVGVAPTDDDDGNKANGNNVQEPSNKTEKATNYYSDQNFIKNKKSWEEMVNSGKKTSGELIAFINSKSKLTEEQIEEIKSWEESHEDA